MKKAILTLVAFFLILFCAAQTHVPIGTLDHADQLGGYGWAFDEDAGTQPIDVHVYIDGRLYAMLTADQSRPDLVLDGITPNPEHGFSFTITGFDTTRAHEIVIYAIDFGGTSNSILTNCPFRSGNQPSGDASISNMAGPSLITISTSERLAGAIGSLVWDGKEFINSFDHGRELQSATSFNSLSECFNPTEAGSAKDDTGSTSTSFLQYLYASGNELETQTLPAFWTQPGDTAPLCGYAVNTTAKSSHYFHKKVSIGMPGMPHVIQYNTEFDIPADSIFSIGAFEVLTGYMPPDFSVFLNYEPVSQQLSPLSDGPGEQQIPIIFSTTDSSYAMGIYTPDLPDTTYPDDGYGRFRYDDCTKWNCVFKKSPVDSGTYKFRSYVIVGSLSNVELSMTQLYNYFKITADFVADTVCAGAPTTFTDISAGANPETKYYWDVNNDGIIEDSASPNFSHTFYSGGIYTVKLTVINGVASDHQSSIVKNILVIEPPVAGIISGETTVCEGSQQTYNINSLPEADAYAWSLPSGWSGTSNASLINVTVGTNGGLILVTASNACGTGSPSFLNITINPLPPTPTVSYVLVILSSDASNGNQWYNQDGIIDGATGQIFTPVIPGAYYVIVTDANGCISDTSNIIYYGTTGLNNTSIMHHPYTIYPDPAFDIINIENLSSDQNPEAIITIYNPQGQQLTQCQLKQDTARIDISSFSKGIYFIKIETLNSFKMLKFIKQ